MGYKDDVLMDRKNLKEKNKFRRKKRLKITGKVKKETVEADELKKHIGEIVKVHGSIYKIRKMSDFAFLLLRTKREIIQCIYVEGTAKYPLEELEEESCVILTAFVQEEERSKKGYDLLIQKVEALSRPKFHRNKDAQDCVCWG